jgi:hypothetical protein
MCTDSYVQMDPDIDWNVIGGQGSEHFHRYQQLGETDNIQLSETMTKIFQLFYLLCRRDGSNSNKLSSLDTLKSKLGSKASHDNS